LFKEDLEKFEIYFNILSTINILAWLYIMVLNYFSSMRAMHGLYTVANLIKLPFLITKSCLLHLRPHYFFSGFSS